MKRKMDSSINITATAAPTELPMTAELFTTDEFSCLLRFDSVNTKYNNNDWSRFTYTEHYLWAKFHDTIGDGFEVIQQIRFPCTKIQVGQINICRAMVPVLCTYEIMLYICTKGCLNI